MYRSILRNIARTHLKEIGVDHLNKKNPRTKKSKFATNWKQYVEVKSNV